MNCIDGTRGMMHQIRSLLHVMDGDTYSAPLELFNGSTIGQHFRHIIDFYSCLARGLEVGVVDYSARERDWLAETVPTVAAQLLERLEHSLLERDEGLPLGVLAEFTPDARQDRPLVNSSLGRELMFAHDHAVHHLAMIRIGLRVAAPGLEIEQSIGVAPSTIKHRDGGAPG